MIPDEIIDYIFQFAFYPHQYPFEKNIAFNKCLLNIPRANKTFLMVSYKPYTKIHHFKYKHKIFNKTLLLNVCHRFNDLNNDQ